MKPNYTREEFLDLLARFSNKQSTPEENEIVLKWIEEFGTNQPILINSEKKARIQADLWNQISNQTSPLSNVKTRRLLQRPIIWSVAATLLILISISIGLFIKSDTDSQLITKQQPVSVWTEVRNSDLARKRIELTDGSTIWLSTNGIVNYNLTDNQSERFVKLEGEAYFEVSPNKEKPFIVLAQDMVTKVLGTKFTVNAPGPGKNLIVSVNSGKVSVSNTAKSQEVILLPDQQVVYNPSSKSFTQEVTNEMKNKKSQTLYRMTFDEEPVSSILLLLEKTYEVDIEFEAEKVSTCIVTTAFDEESLYERLTIISKIIGATYKVENQVIYFESNGCK